MLVRCLSALMMVIAATTAQADTVAIGFAELPDPASQSFDDPFTDLDVATLSSLGELVTIAEQIATTQPDEARLSDLENRQRELRESLAVRGIDADTILSQRGAVSERRKRAAHGTNPEFDGSTVSLTGFLIVADHAEDDGVAVGYLVEEFGMCSHTPAPPPNQLVRVLFPSTREATLPHIPLRVTGRLTATATDTTIYLIDGSRRMLSEWTLEADGIEVLAAVSENAWTARLLNATGNAKENR